MTKDEKLFLKGVLDSLHDDYNKEIRIKRVVSAVPCARRYEITAKRKSRKSAEIIPLHIPIDSDMLRDVDKGSGDIVKLGGLEK